MCSSQTKICNTCFTEQTLTGFYKSRGMRDGVMNKCINCFNARLRALWPKTYTPELRAEKKQYRKENRKRDAVRLQNWRKENPDKTREYGQHIENLWYPGWSWDNYGKIWEIDHVKPCAKFDLTDPAQQRVCFHFYNTQPLLISENRSKQDTFNG